MRVIKRAVKYQQLRILTVRQSTLQTCGASLMRLASRLRHISVEVSTMCLPRTFTRLITCSSSQSIRVEAHLASARVQQVITQTPPTSNSYCNKTVGTSRQRITTRHLERCNNKRSFRKSAEQTRKDEIVRELRALALHCIRAPHPTQAYHPTSIECLACWSSDTRHSEERNNSELYHTYYIHSVFKFKSS